MNKIVTISLMVVFLIAFSFTMVNAQFYSTRYVQDSGNPGGLNNDTDSGTTGWTELVGPSNTGNLWSAADSIPFNFEFFGTAVTHFKVSQNGLLTFDTSAVALPDSNENLPSANLPDQVIACFWDTVTNSPPTGSNDRIYTKVFGTAPARQLWIKYHSFEYGSPNTSFAYFALVLEETTNSIFVIDMNYFSNNVTATVGVQQDNMTAVQYGDDMTAFGSGGSSNGDNDYYEFYIPLANDLSVRNVVVPFYAFPGVAATIWAEVVNFGTNAQTGFDVTYDVDDGTSFTYNYAGTLNPDEAVLIEFPTQWTPADTGTFNIAAYTSLAGDENMLNDTSFAVVVTDTLSMLPLEQDFTAYSGSPNSIEWFGDDNEDFGIFTPSTSGDGSWFYDDFGNDAALTRSARFNLFSASAIDNDWLITPAMDMTSGGPGNRLIFDAAITPYTGTAPAMMPPEDTVFVVASTNGTVWLRDNIIGYITAADSLPPTGMTMNFDLSAYDTEPVLYIGFMAADDPGPDDINFYFDNVFVGVPAAIDVGVTNAFNVPGSVLPGTTVNIDFEISNLGLDPLVADTVDLWVNGVLSSSYEYMALDSGMVDTVAVSYVASGVATVDTVTAALRMVTGDPDQTNDTLSVFVEVTPPVVAPFFEDFESSVTPDLPAGWTNEAGDDFDWTSDAGGTVSSGTGPDFDHTLGTAAGIYVYTEASGANSPYKVALMTTPWLDLSGLTAPALSFWYHMAGGAMGDLHVDVWDGTTWHLDIQDPLSGPQQADPTDPWKYRTADLSGYGNTVKVRFRGITGGSWSSDMAVDDVTIDEASLIPYDISAGNIQMPVLSLVPISQPSITGNLEIATSFSNQAADNTGDITMEIYDTTGTVVETDGDIGVTIPGFGSSNFSYVVDASEADTGVAFTAAIFATNFTDTVAANDTSWAYPVVFGDQMGYDQGNWDVNLAFTSPGGRTQFATRFDLLDDDVLKYVTLGLGSGGATDSFSIDLYTNDADTPSVMLNRIFRGTIADAGGPSAVVTFMAPDIPLTAGDYWIVFDLDVVNNYPIGADDQAINPVDYPRHFAMAYDAGWVWLENSSFGGYTPILRIGLSGEYPPPPDPSVIYADDFEAYTAGTALTVQNNVDWQTWSGTPGTAEDPIVSSTYSNSGMNSVNIVTNNDVVKVMPNYTTGAYKVSFDLYVPTGTVAYFNTLQEFTPTPQWGMQVYFRAGGVGDIDGGAATAATFSYAYDTWLHNEVYVNLEKDTAEYYLDGVRVHGWKWTDGTFGTPGPKQLGGNNFFGGGPTGTFDFYIDDYELKEMSPALFFDNFDAYTAGTQLVVQNPLDWTTWSGTPGTAEDPMVSDAYAYSGPNSVVAVQNNDFIYDFGPVTTGVYTMSMMVYVPDGQSGYFNAMSEFTLPSTFEWGMECYFNVGGAGEVFGGSSTAVPFTFTHDTWHMVEVVVDLDQDIAEFRLNGTAIHQWVWTDGASGTGAQLQLDANDFFGAAGTDEFYIDDYMVDVNIDTIFNSIGEDFADVPIAFDLKQNYPNPFNPTTTIKYQLPNKTDVKIIIYNVLGQAVRTIVDKSVNAGYHEVVWDGLNQTGGQVATGVYFYRMETDNFVKTHKMILMK